MKAKDVKNIKERSSLFFSQVLQLLLCKESVL